MTILIKSALIIDPSSPYNNKRLDIYIEGDEIITIDENLDIKSEVVIDDPDLCVSPGWMDIHSDFSDPGNEHKEDIDSGSKVAAFGGFTSICLSPETHPVIQTKSDIEYVYNKAEDQPINIYPLGGFTKNLKGLEINELFDMFENGAIGFYNGKKQVKDPNILKIGMQYSRTFNAPIILYANDASLSDGGQMSEGVTSTYLGLKGIPSIAEEIEVDRIIQIAEYCDKNVHITGVSSERSIELIKQAKEKGLNITASVNLYNLVLNETALDEYDTNLKVLPPIRSESDRIALVEGLKSGTIDCISIDHVPQDVEVKNCEFNSADFGMRGLETALGVYGKYLSKELGWENWVKWISIVPRQIMDAPKISINSGSVAELTLFNTKKTWTFKKTGYKLASDNNPFLESELKGKCQGIINKGYYWLSDFKS